MANSISISSDGSFRNGSGDRRLIFNGEQKARPNKQVKRRPFSPLVMIFAVLTIALIAVFFIWNKIAVNHLVSDIDRMQIEYQNIIGKNEILRAEVSKQSRPERIEPIAQEQLGLIFRKEQPVLFHIEPVVSK